MRGFKGVREFRFSWAHACTRLSSPWECLCLLFQPVSVQEALPLLEHLILTAPLFCISWALLLIPPVHHHWLLVYFSVSVVLSKKISQSHFLSVGVIFASLVFLFFFLFNLVVCGFLFLINFYWCIVALQCCVDFCFTAKWFSYM